MASQAKAKKFSKPQPIQSSRIEDSLTSTSICLEFSPTTLGKLPLSRGNLPTSTTTPHFGRYTIVPRMGYFSAASLTKKHKRSSKRPMMAHVGPIKPTLSSVIDSREWANTGPRCSLMPSSIRSSAMLVKSTKTPFTELLDACS